MISFMAGAPFTGSTLLCNILAQNEGIVTTGTSPLFNLVESSRQAFATSGEVQAMGNLRLAQERFGGAVGGLMNGWHRDSGDKLVIDKGRGWPALHPWLEHITDTKIPLLFTMRDPRQCVMSLEEKFVKERDRLPGEQHPGPTIEHRANTWLQNILGGPLRLLQDGIMTNRVDDWFIVKYEDLCADPEGMMEAIHEYLELPSFKYDFENIQQQTHEDDSVWGAYGRHVIRPKLSQRIHDPVYPVVDELCHKQYPWVFSAQFKLYPSYKKAA